MRHPARKYQKKPNGGLNWIPRVSPLGLRKIIEHINDGIMVADDKGYVLLCNRAFESITGLEYNDIVGKSAKQIAEHIALPESTVLRVLKEKEPVTLSHILKTGYKVVVTSEPVFGSKNNVMEVICQLRPLTMPPVQEGGQGNTSYRLEEKSDSDLDAITGIVSESIAMRSVLETCVRLSRVNSTVLITGESGVGKDLVARAIHKLSSYAQGDYIKINCGAVPESLLESELFGYEGGAFTGASRAGKAGLIELAKNGTLFLDEVGEMPLSMQIKLLNVLEDRQFMRVGGTKHIRVNTRIIAATNRDLEQLVREGSFRKDLYYRLNVVPIYIPPLRHRRSDILPLIQNFMRQFCCQYGFSKSLSKEAMDCLLRYDWPGNVRELKNVVERIMVMSPSNVIGVQDLPLEIQSSIYLKRLETGIKEKPLKEHLSRVEKRIITQVLSKTSSQKEAAEVLGIDEATLSRKKRKYKIVVPDRVSS